MTTHKRHAQYYAPTSSWASVTGAVTYDMLAFVGESDISPDFFLDKFHGTPPSGNRFVPVNEGAYLKITGLLGHFRLNNECRSAIFFDKSRWKEDNGDYVYVESDLNSIIQPITMDIDELEAEVSDGDVVFLLEAARHWGRLRSMVLKSIDEEKKT